MSVPPQARTRRCRAGRGPLWVKPRVFPKELPVGDFAFKSGEARAAPLPPAQGIPRAPRGAPEPKSWRGSHPGAGASLPRSGTAAGTARAPPSPGAGSGRDKGQRTRGRSSRARPCARSCRWRGRPSPVPGRQPALGTHGALRDLRQPPALPGELPGAALGSVGLSKRVVPVGTPLVWGPLPALPPRPGCGNLCGSCALHRPLRGQTRPDQIRPDQIGPRGAVERARQCQDRDCGPCPWGHSRSPPTVQTRPAPPSLSQFGGLEGRAASLEFLPPPGPVCSVGLSKTVTARADFVEF